VALPTPNPEGAPPRPPPRAKPSVTPIPIETTVTNSAAAVDIFDNITCPLFAELFSVAARMIPSQATPNIQLKRARKTSAVDISQIFRKKIDGQLPSRPDPVSDFAWLVTS
jgi:hypothetical protein